MKCRCRFLIFKAWYTDPDLNTLDLTGTHGNQGQNLSHHQLHQGTPTLGDGNFTSNTGSSNVASASAAAVAAAAAAATASASNAAITATRTGSGKFSNENDSECSSVTSDSMPGG